MATAPFAFTEEDSNDSIPEIFRDSESDEEFYGFTLQDITFGLNSPVRQFHEKRDIDCFVDDRKKRERRSSSRERKEECLMNWQVVMTRIFAIAGIIVFIIFSSVNYLSFTFS